MRSRRRLQAALLKCLARDDQQVRIADVLSVAQVSRSTFYAHYRDLPQLLEDTFSGLAGCSNWRALRH